ncbi:pectinesterase inhibitor-like [Castanea sativa]|uniref:pectinesterase inhibitor-like n=1 Tax=Castanea sativa TaxID=21020 RepID=UPI003F6506D8
MASPINCLSILIIPLLVTSLFYQVSATGPAVDEALLNSVCDKTQDSSFCLATLKGDQRTFVGDKDHLAIVSIAIAIDAVQVTFDQIPGILSKLSDRVDRTRMENCHSDFNDALVTLRKAYAASSSKSYKESTSLIIDATNKLEACHNSYRAPPIRQSPIFDAYTGVYKKTGIAVAVIDTISA